MTQLSCDTAVPPGAGRWGSCGNCSSSLHGPEPSCPEHRSPLTTGNKAEIYTTLLNSVLQQSGLRLCKHRGALRGTEVTERTLHHTGTVFWRILEPCLQEGTSISPDFDCVTTAAPFKAVHPCITGGHEPGPNACSGISCSLTNIALRFLSTIQETAGIPGAAFLFGLLQM